MSPSFPGRWVIDGACHGDRNSVRYIGTLLAQPSGFTNGPGSSTLSQSINRRGRHELDAIGAIGQMLGSVAVFVTLGYLAVQIKHARSEARRALSQGRCEGLTDLLIAQNDERLNHLTVKAQTALGDQPFPFVSALMDQAGLTREEATSLFWMQLGVWNYRLSIIPYVDELTPMERASFEGPVRTYGDQGFYRLFYETMKASMHPDTVRYIDDLLARPRAEVSA